LDAGALALVPIADAVSLYVGLWMCGCECIYVWMWVWCGGGFVSGECVCNCVGGWG